MHIASSKTYITVYINGTEVCILLNLKMHIIACMNNKVCILLNLKIHISVYIYIYIYIYEGLCYSPDVTSVTVC